MIHKLSGIIICLFAILLFTNGISKKSAIEKEKPMISFSFDDGSIDDYRILSNTQWNRKLLENLNKNNLQAILFVKGINLNNVRGKEIMQQWNDAGHFIGNHTYHHPYFSSDKVSLDSMKQELKKTDSLINVYSNHVNIFRFPYLSEGNTTAKRDGFRDFLDAKAYKNGHVTIDASDWYINSRLIKALKGDKEVNLEAYKEFYIKHLFERALFYDSLATELNGRKIKHTILLHHNLVAALFLDELIQHFRENGWQPINYKEAISDPIYKYKPETLPAGQSLIWAMAKESGRFDSILRYPGEDSRYEKKKMDRLGL
ncbi:MAG: polysaccharide deacetylase family protein [Bacteroidetes bacterium]|nr:polysaccharide deacetylase family protein [Bacteroidota bacterium]